MGAMGFYWDFDGPMGGWMHRHCTMKLKSGLFVGQVIPNVFQKLGFRLRQSPARSTIVSRHIRNIGDLRSSNPGSFRVSPNPIFENTFGILDVKLNILYCFKSRIVIFCLVPLEYLHD